MFRSSILGMDRVRWPVAWLAALLVLSLQPGQAQDTQGGAEAGTQAGQGNDFDYAEYWFAIPESARAFYASGLRDGINLVVARELTGGFREGLSEEALTGSVRNRLEDKWHSRWIAIDGKAISNQMDLLYSQSGNANMALDAAAKLAIDQLSGRAGGATSEAVQGEEETKKQN